MGRMGIVRTGKPVRRYGAVGNERRFWPEKRLRVEGRWKEEGWIPEK